MPGVPSSGNGISIAEIKAKARDGVNKEARGASAITLIKTAKNQLLSAKTHEAKGDLQNAFSSYIKAAQLMKMAMESPEYVQESKGPSGGGVVRRELHSLLKEEAADLSSRSNAVEEKLKSIEKANAARESKETPSGGSIADRLRALQDSGLSLGQTKIRDTPTHQPNLPTPPISPRNFPNAPQHITPAPSTSSIASSKSISGQLGHAFVAPSALGPPSPSSTPSSSPPTQKQVDAYDFSGFNQAFPSIDELDENPGFTLPSVPTGIGSSSIPPTNEHRNGNPSPPLHTIRNFPVPIERPSSTPIPPSNNGFPSRPPSPSRLHQPLKSSGLTNGVVPPQPPAPKVPIPVTNVAYPKELLAYIRAHNVLIIDVRNRVDFDREHIKGNAVICVEPSVLMREGVTSDALENSMVVGPRQEASLFGNRDKFDLVAVYDHSSTTFGSDKSPLNVIVRLIYEQAFRKMLKRSPIMLVGGFEAWKRDIGDAEIVRGQSPVDLHKPVPSRTPSSAVLQNGNGHASPANPYTNGASHTQDAQTSHELWTPPQSRMDTGQSIHTRAPNDSAYINGSIPQQNGLSRRPAILRPTSNSISYTRSMNDTITSPVVSQTLSFASNTPPISYPSFPRHITPTSAGPTTSPGPPGTPFMIPTNGPFTSPPTQYDIASPPQASINPSHLSRRRSDFVDQSQEALSTSGFDANARPPAIDYPQLTSPPPIIRPPPAVASTLERQDNRPRVQQMAPPPFSPPAHQMGAPRPPRIQSDILIRYWTDFQIGTSGLKNLGNTCYMNAPIQCLSATVPFATFFIDGRWKHAINYTNTLGSKGKLAGAFAKLLHELSGGDRPYLTPIEFRKSICQLNSQYQGSDQHDSQEFLSFLMDGIHEDLNRIISRPTYTRTPQEEEELERLPPQIASEREWNSWRSRNDSLVVDFFQGQFRNRLECLTCHKTSTTYNVFSILSLPVPTSRGGKVAIDRCLDALLNEEVLEKDDAWDCPQCKTKRRASKKLTLARLPPILMIHFKRFETNGRSSDKVDTFVDFPMRGLDLTNYMPPPLPPGADKSQLNGGLPLLPDDPRTQLPPYRYDLYGVTNHYGNLSSGHYTAFIASRGGWMYCDDSTVKTVDAKSVVSQKAYVLFYKRVQT